MSGKTTSSLTVMSTFTSLPPGQWSRVSELKSIAVRVRLTVFMVKGESDTRLLLNSGIDALKARPNLLERQRLPQRKIQILRKAIIGEVATLQCGSALEGWDRLQVGLSQAAQ